MRNLGSGLPASPRHFAILSFSSRNSYTKIAGGLVALALIKASPQPALPSTTEVELIEFVVDFSYWHQGREPHATLCGEMVSWFLSAGGEAAHMAVPPCLGGGAKKLPAMLPA